MTTKEVEDKVKDLISEKFYHGDLRVEIKLSDELSTFEIDSLDEIEFIMMLEDTFSIDISDEEADGLKTRLKTVNDVVQYVLEKVAAKP